MIEVLFEGESQTARRMRFGQLWVQLQSFAARGLCLVQIVFPAVPVHVKKGGAIRDASVCTGVLWINHDSACKHLPGIVKSLAPKLMEELAAFQIIVIGLGV